MRRLRIVRADPAGNITLFVLTPVEKAQCAAIAADLMKIGELQAEQVGFVFPNGHMEMEAGGVLRQRVPGVWLPAGEAAGADRTPDHAPVRQRV